MPKPLEDEVIARIRALMTGNGYSKREIADLLGISYRTVLRYTEDMPRQRGKPIYRDVPNGNTQPERTRP